MKRTRLVLGMGVLAVVATLAGTALAGSGSEATNAASAKKTAKKALKKAKKANKKAKKAQSAADSAQGTADAAKGTADAASSALNGKTISTGSFNADGSTRAVSGAITGATSTVYTGVWLVNFNRSVASCEVVAVAGHTESGTQAGQIATIAPGTAAGGTANQVAVGTREVPTNTAINHPFTVIAFC